ncbi:integrin alpha-4-like [Ornithodoros turicata]|uniref:integrin alpha-4-like n=1 Tax=Ornithodoros turicata TaxID=34597 RepID=UPI003138D85A
MGEYFGASLLAIRVDQRGGAYDNLLVGAPQFTQPDGMDEGRVYVYRSYGNGLVFDIVLDGGATSQSRFGTSIADIGDINMDGYNDVAVGAPFEDNVGAVYVYHGARDSTFRGNYAQRILASQIASKTGAALRGFGFSISKGYDADKIATMVCRECNLGTRNSRYQRRQCYILTES